MKKIISLHFGFFLLLCGGCMPNEALGPDELDQIWTLSHNPREQSSYHRLKVGELELPARWVIHQNPSVIRSTVSFVRAYDRIKEGTAEGVLTGGCLSVMVSSLGTPAEPDTNGTILFLEDTGEKPYQVDRMLTQLRLSGKLDGVAGIVFGTMEECLLGPNEDYGVEGVISEVLKDLSIPVLYGLPSGHCPDPLILPFGVKAAIREGALWILEQAVK